MKKKWNELTLQKLCVCSCIELHVVTIPEAASWALVSDWSCCQLINSTDTNCLSLSKYCVYISTSLWPAPWAMTKYIFETEDFRNVIWITHLHPQWFNCTRAFLVNCESVRKVNHFVFSAMDDQNRRCYFGYFINTVITTKIYLYIEIDVLWICMHNPPWECIEEPSSPCGRECDSHAGHQWRM